MTTNAKHTPGPLLASKGHEDDPERWVIVADNGTRHYLIATIENGQPGDSLDTEEATAKLFAAAPDLLEALQGFAAALDSAILVEGDHPTSFLAPRLRDALAAIAKATK